MARRSVASLVAAAVLGLTACGDQAILSPSPESASHALLPAPTAGRYLVGFEGAAAIDPSVLAAAGGRVIDSIPVFHVLVVDGVSNPDALRLAQPKFIDGGWDVSAEPIRAKFSLSDGIDALVGQAATPWFQSGVEWDMKAIHADDGWAMTNGGTGIKVCIVDTGVDDQHQELSGGKVILRVNFVASPDTAPTLEERVDDPNGHGSHVAGTTAAKGVVISGVAPRASILSARVLNTLGSGAESAIIKGINWCTDNGAHVINMSLGGARYKAFASYKTSQQAYGMAIDRARTAGAVVITAAGNSNLRLPNSYQVQVPSEVRGAINVGATGPLTKSTAPAPPGWNPLDPAQVWRSPDYKAYYSNFGVGVAVFAPGGIGNVPLSEVYRFVAGAAQGTINDQIWGVCSSNSIQIGASNGGGVPGAVSSCSEVTSKYVPYAGTSQAAPHVAGLAALLYEELGGARSVANGLRVQSCIRGTTDNIGPAATYGGGRINVRSAITALRAHAC